MVAAASVRVRTPEVGLPFHRTAIVELALLPPLPGQRWRLASVDAEGWLRFWADGRLLSMNRAASSNCTASASSMVKKPCLSAWIS